MGLCPTPIPLLIGASPSISIEASHAMLPDDCMSRAAALPPSRARAEGTRKVRCEDHRERSGALVVSAGETTAAADRQGARLGAQSDRRVRPGEAREKG